MGEKITVERPDGKEYSVTAWVAPWRSSPPST